MMVYIIGPLFITLIFDQPKVHHIGNIQETARSSRSVSGRAKNGKKDKRNLMF
jgi:hypothetical protein